VRIEIHGGASHMTADAAKLADVFRSLSENASNYSPEGGVVEIAAVPTVTS
jgi:signal transduction histidine kinase